MKPWIPAELTETEFPVSFLYGGKPSREFVSGWRAEEKEERTDGGIVRTAVRTDPATGLEVRSVVRLYDGVPCADWTVYFTNKGACDTPMLEAVRPLDIILRPGGAEDGGKAGIEGLMFAGDGGYSPGDESLPVLSRIRGSVGCVHFSYDEFRPMRTPVRKGDRHIFGPDRYNSSFDEFAPFFELAWPGGGVVTAVGWTGKWTASAEGLEDGSVRVSAGMADLHTVLHPGETIRTPRILQVYWAGGDPDAGYNLFRQVMLRHVLPKKDCRPALPPVASPCTQENFAANRENQMRHIERDMDGLGFEVYWLDAWWHRGAFPAGMGNYTFPIENAVDPDRFPGGIAPISRAAHERGYRFLLWFAPETAMKDTCMMREHPEWLLFSPDGNCDSATLNLGIPEAREYIAKFMNACIREWNVDIWRTDSGPAPEHIAGNDKDPQRRGMLEIRYVEGLYRLWDDLLEANPGLMIDNCCGGGTRVDLETCARSMPLWRTDSSVWSIGWRDPMRTAAVNQVITMSLNRYMPASLSGTMGIDPYCVRSGFNGGFLLYDAIPEGAEARGELKKAIAECKRLRRYAVGDFYTPVFLSHDPREWCAWQYHLREENAGMVMAFRRQDSPFSAAELRLKGIDPGAWYELEYYETYECKKTETVRGSGMRDLAVEIASKPGSLLIEYRAVK